MKLFIGCSNGYGSCNYRSRSRCIGGLVVVSDSVVDLSVGRETNIAANLIVGADLFLVVELVVDVQMETKTEMGME